MLSRRDHADASDFKITTEHNMGPLSVIGSPR